MAVHFLKSWPEHFQPVWEGQKRFEVRRDDRQFRDGDFIELQEWDPETEAYTGRELIAVVMYKLDGGRLGVADGYCVLGLSGVTGYKVPHG